MTYSSEVLADTPTIWLRHDDTSISPNGCLDSSGNGRDLNVAVASTSSSQVQLSSLPTLGLTGPKKLGMSFGTSPIALRSTYTQTQPTTGTHEGWIKFTANPASDVCLWTWAAPVTGSFGTILAVYLTTLGKIRLDTWVGSNHSITSSAALTTGAWHHTIASIGAAGTKVRVDKATVASGADTAASATGASAAFWVHGQYNGTFPTAMTGAVMFAESAFYPSQLSDARTDAHYDAAQDSAIISGTWGVAS